MNQIIRPALRALGCAIVGAALAPSVPWAAELAVKQLSAPLEVEPGGTVMLVVQTEPGASCDGQRQGHYGDDYSIALGRQTAAADGHASWHWDVLPGHNPIGRRGVRIACRKDGRQGTLETDFVVK